METNRSCPNCGKPLTPAALQGLCPQCQLEQRIASQAETKVVPAAALPRSPGAGFVAPSPEALARFLPGQEIIELMGQGGMGAVYKARQKNLDRHVAVKILPPETSGDPAFAERFAREARALARLNHPNIVSVYDFGQSDGLYYFLMEYVDGVNLRQLELTRRLSPQETLAIIPMICDALQYAHDESVVHRDIKPGNILIDKKGRVKIADFGLAKLLGQTGGDYTLTAAGMVMGTPVYMAPEQLERPAEVDHRADIYSLGVVIYEMLTGELPLGRFALPSQKVQVDARLDEIVLRTLEPERERRYQRVSEVKSDVQTIAGIVESLPPARLVPEEVKRAVKPPAIGLIAAGSLNWIAVPILRRSWEIAPMETIQAPLTLLIMAASVAIIFGAVRMTRCESYAWAILSSILAMVALPGNIVGLPMGVWSLAVLSRPEVKAAFRRQRTRRSGASLVTAISIAGVMLQGAFAR